MRRWIELVEGIFLWLLLIVFPVVHSSLALVLFAAISRLSSPSDERHAKSTESFPLFHHFQIAGRQVHAVNPYSRVQILRHSRTTSRTRISLVHYANLEIN